MFRYLKGPLTHPRFYSEYSGPLIKSYNALKTPISVFWATKIPPAAKTFSAVVLFAALLGSIHPDLIITAMPPIVIGGPLLYKRYEQMQYRKALVLALLLRDLLHEPFKVTPYNESDLNLVKKGIESEYDYFLSLAHPYIETRMMDYLLKCELQEVVCSFLDGLIDENGQVNVHMEDSPETFVMLQAEYPPLESELQMQPQVVDFISFSIPFYDTKDPTSRTRLGVFQVSMIQRPRTMNPGTENCDYYDTGIKIWPFALFPKAVVVS